MPILFASIEGLRRTDALARRYGTTPAALLHEHDPYTAYCINEACALAAGEWQAAETTPALPQEATPRPPPAPQFEYFDNQVGPLLVGTIGRYDE